MSSSTPKVIRSSVLDDPIALLSPKVAEQIAAGEVIDRPAAVVRELVDNALDAGASRIDVVIEGGGRRLIRVVDDGRGMSPAQVRLALERHATSKLRDLDDLLRMRTLGFRGEGLTSVALVSRLTIRTRPREDDQGTEIEVDGGRVIETRPVGCPVGTSVEVRDLFYNVPVRRKFLKSLATEAALVTETVEGQALAWCAVRFELSVEGRRTLNAPPTSERRERVRALLRAKGEGLVSKRRVEDAVRLEVHLLAPRQSLSTTRGLRFIVNGRPVRDRTLLAAVTRGTEGRLPRGRYPRGVIYVDVDPADLDINVHPQKSEVRFARPRHLFDRLLAMSRELFGEGASRGAPAERVTSEATSPAAAVRTYRLGGGGQQAAAEGERARYVDQRARIREATRRFWAEQPRREESEDFGLGAALAKAAAAGGQGVRSPREAAAPRRRDERGEKNASPVVALIGRSRRGLVLAERGDAILIVDPLAAARRILRRSLERTIAEGGLPRGELSPPPTMGADLAGEVEARRAALMVLGFEVEAFGSGAWVLRSAPTVLAPHDSATLLEALKALVRDVPVGVSPPLGGALDTIVAYAKLEALPEEELLARIDDLGSPRELRPEAPPRREGEEAIWRVDLGRRRGSR